MLHLAQPPGRSAISMTRTLYIDAGGDNATAEIGNPSKPFSTAQAAFDAALAAAGNYLLKFGVGSFGTIVVPTGGWPSRIAISGCGYSVSRLTGITATGAVGANGTSGASPTPGAAGGAAKAVSIRSDGTINIGVLNCNGGAGGSGGGYAGIYAADGNPGATGSAGGTGGNGGAIELVGVVFDQIRNDGGNGGAGGEGQEGYPGSVENWTPGGAGGDGGVGGNPGVRGRLSMHHCFCTSAGTGQINSSHGEVGAGGAGGNSGYDIGAGTGSPGAEGGQGTAPTGVTIDFIIWNSGVGYITLNSTEGEEIMGQTAYAGIMLNGFGGSMVGGDLGGNILTEVHQLP